MLTALTYPSRCRLPPLMNPARRRTLFPTFYRLHLKPWTASARAFPPVALYFALADAYTLARPRRPDDPRGGAFLLVRRSGGFFRIAGGTIMQLLLPFVLAAHFFLNRYRLGMQLMLVWLGQSLINVSVYAADARARQLPLLGGDRSQPRLVEHAGDARPLGV